MSGTRLHGLDALRGIAAMLVVVLHTQSVFHFWPPPVGKGYLAVDFFLMLSGYLMARFTEPKLAAGAAPMRFMVARYRRFWPMIALGCAIGTPFLWARTTGLSQFLPVFLANMAMLPFPFDRVMFALNIPAWYVFFELVANGVHVFALRRLGNRSLVILAAVPLAMTTLVTITINSLDVGARPSTFLAGFPRVLLSYMLGMLMWRLQGTKAPLPVPGWLAVAAMPVAVLASWLTGWKDWTFDLAFVLVLVPLTMQGALNITRETRIGALSAAISFPLFAIHLPILEAMRELGFGWTVALPTALLAALAVTWWTKRPARPMAAATS